MIRVGVIAAALLGVSMASCAGDSATQTTSESMNDSFEAATSGAVADKIPADVIIVDSAFMGLPTTLGEELAQLPEVAVVSPVRPWSIVVDDEEVFVAGVDPTTFGTLADLGFTEGSFEDLADGGVALHRATAEAMGVEVGGSIDVTWPSGDSATIEVVGVFTEATFGNWITSLTKCLSTRPRSHEMCSSWCSWTAAAPRAKADPRSRPCSSRTRPHRRSGDPTSKPVWWPTESGSADRQW